MTSKSALRIGVLLLLPACAPARSPQPDTTAAAAAPSGMDATIGAAAVERLARGVSISGAGPGEVAAEDAASARLRRAFALEPGSAARRAALDSIQRDLGLDFPVALTRFSANSAEPAPARAQALLALAETNPSTLDPFAEALDDSAMVVRAAAAAGLGRLFQPAPRTNPVEVEHLLAKALADHAAEVQAAALQSLSDRDAPTLRHYLAGHPRADLAAVARQLLTLAEERGAALVPDSAGALTLETAGGVTLHYTPTRRFAGIGASEGTLTARPRGGTAVRLAGGVEVVGDVLPAVVSPDGHYVAYEADRTIHVRDLRDDKDRSLGAGIAPRPMPFGGGFLYLKPEAVKALARGNTLLTYRVLSVGFGPAPHGVRTTDLGEAAATPSMALHGNYAPVRWMRVVETAGHFTLQGASMRPFALPNPFAAGGP